MVLGCASEVGWVVAMLFLDKVRRGTRPVVRAVMGRAEVVVVVVAVFVVEASRETVVVGRGTVEVGRGTVEAGRETLDVGRGTAEVGRETVEPGRAAALAGRPATPLTACAPGRALPTVWVDTGFLTGSPTRPVVLIAPIVGPTDRAPPTAFDCC